jgi:hypothetical protein
MMSTGVFTKFPNINFIFSHNAGAFPFLADRMHYQNLDTTIQSTNNNSTIRDLVATANIFFETSQSAPFQWPVSLGIGLPKSHVLHGTDWPFTAQPDRRGVAGVGVDGPRVSGCFSEAEVEVVIARRNTLGLLPRVKAEFLKAFGEAAFSTEGLGEAAPNACRVIPVLSVAD